MKSDQKFVAYMLGIVIAALIVLGGVTVVIDPFFHYHGPLEQLQYPIEDERYQNDGIAKHFRYDAIITGSSMTDNFKTTEANELFQADFIKIPYSGAFYKEVNDTLEAAIKANPDIRIVIRGLDAGFMPVDKDRYVYDTYPDYLYDDNLVNDVNYFWNKTVLFDYSIKVLSYTSHGGQTTSFDSYSNWNSYSVFGKEAVNSAYQRPEKSETEQVWQSGDKETLEKNIEQNVIRLVEDNPDITFYLFIPPCSIYNWDLWNQRGSLRYQLEAQKRTIEMLVQYDNIKMFGFFTNFELICDASHYKDAVHYSEDINSQILNWMKMGQYQLTEENYLDYCKEVGEFYISYDYESLFE